jgi:hypothetical protein
MMMPDQNERAHGRDDQPIPHPGQARPEPGRTAAQQTQQPPQTQQVPPEQPCPQQPPSGQPRPEHGAPDHGRSGHPPPGQPGGSGQDGRPERLVPADRAEAYGSRWDAVKGAFVDDPRAAVAQADALVGELLDELETVFREQRRRIEQSLDADETSTEDLRLALRRYRSFFDRLLSV